MKISGISLVLLIISGILGAPIGMSSASAIQSIPLPPIDLNATAVSGTQIFLVWNQPINASQSGVTGYRVEISPSCTNSFNFLANTTTTSFVSNGMTNGTCYQFRVESVNAVGSSTPSSIVSTTTLSVPSSPTALLAHAVSPSQINLGWTASGNNGGTSIKGYKIERENSCTDNFITITTTANATTGYSDTGLSANTCYQYRIYAINAIGTSSASNNAIATTMHIPLQIHVPNAPTGLNVTTISNSSLKLTWAMPSNNGGSPITGYLIQRNGTTIVNNTFSNDTIYIDTNLLSAHQQRYQVAAWNSAGQSSFSNLAFGITILTVTTPQNNSTNQTLSSTANLGQLVSDFVHKRNDLLKQQRQETITLIHDCHAQIKNTSPENRTQIKEYCKAKIKEVKEKYKELQKQLKEQFMELKTQFKSQRHEDKNKQHSDKKLQHLENATKQSENKFTHLENKMNHAEKKSKEHGNSDANKKRHNNKED